MATEKICEIFKNTYFDENLRKTISVHSQFVIYFKKVILSTANSLRLQLHKGKGLM